MPQFLLLILVGLHFKAFSFVLKPFKMRSSNVFMGGRSLAEKKLSKKQLFRNVREHLRQASKLPGFFDEPEDKIVIISLYCDK